ncbi:MAG: hypothetical protein LBK18_04880 [Prevotellaceae bacterium]|jgi:hypothetical protein|nr:hypothetical protein [Prevotellaceae bacterium]
MKSKLDAALPSGKIEHVEYADSEIYVVDYTERTQSQRGVEACNAKPEGMDALTLKNEAHLDITTSIFGKQCFMDSQNKELKHCECVLYPTASAGVGDCQKKCIFVGSNMRRNMHNHARR